MPFLFGGGRNVETEIVDSRQNRLLFVVLTLKPEEKPVDKGIFTPKKGGKQQKNGKNDKKCKKSLASLNAVKYNKPVPEIRVRR